MSGTPDYDWIIRMRDDGGEGREQIPETKKGFRVGQKGRGNLTGFQPEVPKQY